MTKQNQLKILNKVDHQISKLSRDKTTDKDEQAKLQNTFTTIDNEMLKASQNDLKLNDRYNIMLNKKGITTKMEVADMLPSKSDKVPLKTAKMDNMIKKSLKGLKEIPETAWLQTTNPAKSGTSLMFQPLTVARVHSVGKSIHKMADQLSNQIHKAHHSYTVSAVSPSHQTSMSKPEKAQLLKQSQSLER